MARVTSCRNKIGKFRVFFAMQTQLDLTLIFPIKDATSAVFMALKAACLCEAGIITESDKEWVDARASSMLRSPSKETHLNTAA
jgi:hypothetical protein